MFELIKVNHLFHINIIRYQTAAAAAAAAKSLQSCPNLCDPIDRSPPGSPVPGILQARTLEWVAISFSNAWKWKVKVKLFSHVQLLATPWTAAYQGPPSMGFSRQEYWSWGAIAFSGSSVKNPPAVQETWVRSLGQEDALEKEMTIHFQCFCLENLMDRGAWQAIVHRVAKSQTLLCD